MIDRHIIQYTAHMRGRQGSLSTPVFYEKTCSFSLFFAIFNAKSNMPKKEHRPAGLL